MREQIFAIFQKHLPRRRFRPSGGSNYITTCPFHKGGEEKTPSFSVNIDTGAWHCFTCHEGGSIKRLLTLLGLGHSQVDIETRLIQPFLARQREVLRVERQYTFTRADPFKADFVLDEGILGVYEWMPLKLVEDGFDPELLQRLEIGFDRAHNRIMYPLRDLYGDLAGFSGGATMSTQHPKYLVYQGRRKNAAGKWIESDYGEWFDEKYPGYRCENHDFLWNFDRIYEQLLATSDQNARLYVVEGFKACMWMLQCGYPFTTALMGSYISDRQQKMLHRLGCTVVLLFDNDDAGRNATLNVGSLLWRPLYGRIMVAQYPEADVISSRNGVDKSQPDDYVPEAVHEIVGRSLMFEEHFQRVMRSQ